MLEGEVKETQVALEQYADNDPSRVEAMSATSIFCMSRSPPIGVDPDSDHDLHYELFLGSLAIPGCCIRPDVRNTKQYTPLLQNALCNPSGLCRWSVTCPEATDLAHAEEATQTARLAANRWLGASNAYFRLFTVCVSGSCWTSR